MGNVCNLDRTRGTKAGGGNISQLLSPGWLKVFNPGPPEAEEFPRYNKAEIEWYVRMPNEPPPADPKAKHNLSYMMKQVPLRNQSIPRGIVSFHI